MPLPPPDGGRYGDPRFSNTGGKKKSAMMIGGGGSLGNSAARKFEKIIILRQVSTNDRFICFKNSCLCRYLIYI